MPAPDLFLLFVRPLNQTGIPYAVTGSVASIFYGEPRVTHDVDMILFLKGSNISLLEKFFPAPDFYLPPPETILEETTRERRGHFNIIHVETGFKADVYPTGRDELNQWALRGRRTVEYEGEQILVAPPEYVIVRKLEYYREGQSEKHLRDVRSMLSVSTSQIDKLVINEWIKARGLENEWQIASNS